MLVLAHQPVVAAIQFDDVSVGAGFSFSGETYGAAWGNFNGDARPDLFVSHHRLMKGLYINNGDGTFTDGGAAVLTWATTPDADTHGGSWADFDNDGDQDLMVSVGRGGRNQFFVNSGGQLTDQTVAYNLLYPEWAGRLPVWFDYNSDGLLDFIMGQFNGISPLIAQTTAGFVDITASTGMDCMLMPYGQLLDINFDGRMEFICGRDGRFPYRVYDIGTLPFLNLTATLPSTLNVVDTVIADFDGDLRQDMFLVRGNMRSSDVVADGTTKLEAALVDGTKGFTFVTDGTLTLDVDWQPLDGGDFRKIRIGSSGMSPTTMPFTLDPADSQVQGMPVHDAASDPVMHIGYDAATQKWTVVHYAGAEFSNVYILISSTSTISGLTTTGFAANDGPLSPVLFKTYGSGTVDTAAASGLGAPASCVSAAAADFDNDMDTDLYVICRAGARNLVNRLYENRGNGIFDEVAAAGGAEGPAGPAIGSGAGTADSVVTADYDLDGFMDLFVTNGLNMRPVELGGPDKLYRNSGNANHWVELDLVGDASNRDAVGARVIATAGGKSQLREQNGGYHRWSQNHTRLHFGLAANVLVDLRIEWPSGLVEIHPGVLGDRVYRVTEGGGLAVIAGEPVPSAVLSISGASVPENAGQAAFTVTLAAPAADTVQVDYATANATATAGTDYTAVSGTLSFAPGQTSQTILVPVLNDTVSESDETFTVMLANAVNATLSSSQATGTIQDDDLSACGTPAYNPGVTGAMFVWRDCSAGTWFVRVTAGGTGKTANYSGVVTADAAFTSVVNFSIESVYDVVSVATSPPAINFFMKVSNAYQDGFNFVLPDTAQACISLSNPANATVLVGASQTPVTQPFRLDTLGPCGAPPASMATPTVNALTTNDQTPIITGTFDAARTVTLNVKLNGVLYTLGSSPRLTSVSDTWILDLSTKPPMAPGTYPVTATGIDADGARKTDTTTNELVIY